MRTYRASRGPFAEGVFYSDDEIERMCSDALVKTGLMPNSPTKVRIDRFVEKHFGVPIIYESLDKGVLGFTSFGSKGVESIHVAQLTDRSLASERRINSTLAHEAGHGLMHTHLFCDEFHDPKLFSGDRDVSSNKILCRDGDATSRPRVYDGRWWEVQANKAIGTLLMPKALVLAFIEPFVQRQGFFELQILDESRREEAVRVAAETFDVNPMVARIRIEQLFKKSDGKQLTL